ncbi:MAG TPA: general secretion pathway protein GspB [Steroidobacteraceae bacterium]|nr:general secretion pathway protein GspB [Steroidobacteraceae bacterium]
MSFILDALKKSEREREQLAQGAQPAVVYRRAQSQPVWMFVVIGLLLLNMMLVMVMWLRSDRAQTAPMITVNNAAPVAPASTQSVMQPVAGSATAAGPGNDLRSLQDEAQPQEDRTAAILANADPPAGPPLVRQIRPEDAEAGKIVSSGAVSTDPKKTGSIIPSLDSLGGNAALNLPPLHLDIHVYSVTAAERFVFINMKKYAEGQTLKEGPLLEHITPDGAVLKYGDQEFLLPRQ